MTNLVSGNSAATFSMADVQAKDTATTGLKPLLAKLRIACSPCVSLVGSKSRNSMPVSALNFSAPAAAASLNDLSNLPPVP
ncbi:hypothetical protein D3C87_1743830 [compost metagenome]